MARHGGEIVATLTVSDMGPMKRNVLLDAPGVMKGSLALLRFGTAPLPGFVVPRIGDALRLLSVRHAACDAGHQAALAALLRRARAVTLRRRFTSLALGLHEHDPLRSLVRGIPRFTFTSLAFVTSLGSPRRLKELAQGTPFEDYALV